jgi:hypothetical protein
VLGGKKLEVPVFTGYWANPESIESFACQHFTLFEMKLTFQVF